MALLLAASAAAPLGCGKEAPKKVEDNPTRTTPVPSDLVFNDFLPPTGGGAGVVGVKFDGGLLEGGMAAAEGTARSGAGGDPAGAAPEPAEGVKTTVVDPGAEPRVARRYAFVANRVDRRVITIKQSASREGGGPGQEAAFAFTVELSPRTVTATKTRFEMKLVKLELPGLPPAEKARAAAQLAGFAGLTATFDVSARGEVGEIEFKDDKLAAGAEMVLQPLQQAMELLVPPFPEAPIGVGAKWERTVERKERGLENSAKHAFALKELGAEGGVVTADVDIAVPKHPFQQRGVPPGATEEVKGKGSYTYTFKLDHIATKVDGEMSVAQRIELVDPRSGQKQSTGTTAKLKSSLETAGGGPAVAPAPKP
jgi:hypothetical protein